MQLLERSLQHCRLLLTLGIIGRASHQHTDPAHPLARLCSRHKRPCSRTAEKCDELAPSHRRSRSSGRAMVAVKSSAPEGVDHVRFGS
jgi:hypothetical protein